MARFGRPEGGRRAAGQGGNHACSIRGHAWHDSLARRLTKVGRLEQAIGGGETRTRRSRNSPDQRQPRLSMPCARLRETENVRARKNLTTNTLLYVGAIYVLHERTYGALATAWTRRGRRCAASRPQPAVTRCASVLRRDMRPVRRRRCGLVLMSLQCQHSCHAAASPAGEHHAATTLNWLVS